MKKIAITWAGTLVFLGIFGYVGHLEQQDQIAAEAHAKHVKQLAQKEEAERKAEFNFLAKQATEKTGFEAVMK